jgi:hypothetical protein
MIRIDDSQIVAAYTSLRTESGASADTVLVDPVIRNQFLDLIRQQVGDVEEAPVLKRLLNPRKRCRLPRL